MGLFDGTPLERPVLCGHCGQPIAECTCPADITADVRPEQQRLRIRLEKRKRGKVVTVISGFGCSPSQIAQVLKQLKGECGAGGTSDQDYVEIQGEHCDRVRQRLAELGYKIAN